MFVGSRKMEFHFDYEPGVVLAEINLIKTVLVNLIDKQEPSPASLSISNSLLCIFKISTQSARPSPAPFLLLARDGRRDYRRRDL